MRKALLFDWHSHWSSCSAWWGWWSGRRSSEWSWTGVAASDREMSQCYELLIATHPIHILMPNPSPPIGPSSPQHGEGKDENLYFTLPKPPPTFFPLWKIKFKPLPPLQSLWILFTLSLSFSLFLSPCLAADHSFPNRNLIVAPARWGHQHCSTISFGLVFVFARWGHHCSTVSFVFAKCLYLYSYFPVGVNTALPSDLYLPSICICVCICQVGSPHSR